MGELRQRVGLVHELGELATAEELLHGGDHRPDVDEGAGRGLFRVGNRHALADDALHAEEADAELLLNEFANGTHATVAEVVDVVAVAAAVVDVDRALSMIASRSLGRSQRWLGRPPGVEAAVELVAANATEVVAAGVEEECLERGYGRFRAWAGRRDECAGRTQGAPRACSCSVRSADGGVACTRQTSLVSTSSNMASTRSSVPSVSSRARSAASRAFSRSGLFGDSVEGVVGSPVLRKRGVVAVAGEQAGDVDGADQRGDRNLALAIDLDERMSRFEVSNSSQAPRLGMSLAEQRRRPVCVSFSMV